MQRVSRGGAPLGRAAQAALLASLEGSGPAGRADEWKALREAALVLGTAVDASETDLDWAVGVYSTAMGRARATEDYGEMVCCITPLAETLLPRAIARARRTRGADLAQTGTGTRGRGAGERAPQQDDDEEQRGSKLEALDAALVDVRAGRLLYAAALGPGFAVDAVRAAHTLLGREGWVRTAVEALLADDVARLSRLRRSAPTDAQPWLAMVLTVRRDRTVRQAAAAFIDLSVAVLLDWLALPGTAAGLASLQSLLARLAPRARLDEARGLVDFRPPRSAAAPATAAPVSPVVAAGS